jgi:hypothetical protein
VPPLQLLVRGATEHEEQSEHLHPKASDPGPNFEGKLSPQDVHGYRYSASDEYISACKGSSSKRSEQWTMASSNSGGVAAGISTGLAWQPVVVAPYIKHESRTRGWIQVGTPLEAVWDLLRLCRHRCGQDLRTQQPDASAVGQVFQSNLGRLRRRRIGFGATISRFDEPLTVDEATDFSEAPCGFMPPSRSPRESILLQLSVRNTPETTANDCQTTTRRPRGNDLRGHGHGHSHFAR